ncbi:hypothetical protein C2G38_2188736 [Gigaspora rosea]|uniref:VWFA domain-containing protein n=1 Tax=Gigaspora rosea TaxID=44941 RepID=A0A397V3C7_9GLOM|nr:hypothetical protein C2G38_2188736 [Gigaspora rosea]
MDNEKSNIESNIGDLVPKSNGTNRTPEDYERSTTVNFRQATIMQKDKKLDRETVDTQINSQRDNCYDLCESIPGLYRLLDLCKDKGSNGLVVKVLISQQYLKKLCNEMVPNSFRSISKIRFERLNSQHIRLIGCYGRNDLIAKLLLHKSIIDQTTYELLLIPYEANALRHLSTLRPGIYLQRLPSISGDNNSVSQQFLVIHWSENGCYEDSASSYRKKNMTNLHRYLTKITTHQLCLMSDSDIENSDWNLLGKDFDDDDDDENENNERAFLYDFEVKKSQEQKEDFELYKGFDIPLLMPSLQNSTDKRLDGSPLHPLIVESVSNQTLLIRKMKAATTTTDKNSRITLDSLPRFQEFFKKHLEIQKCALSINRNHMTIQELQVLVEDGMNIIDLFLPYHEELKKLEDAKNELVNKTIANIQMDMGIFEQIAYQILDQFYSNFENSISDYGSQNFETKLDEETYNRIDQAYPGMIQGLRDEITYIPIPSWNRLKTRFLFAKYCAENINQSSQHNIIESIHYSQDSNTQATISASKVFLDEEKNFSELIRKYTTKAIDSGWTFFGFFKRLNNSDTSEVMNKIKSEAEKIPDNEFVNQIFELKDEIIAAKFLKEYEEWRKHKFVQIVRHIIQTFKKNVEKIQIAKVEQDHDRKVKDVEMRHYEVIFYAKIIDSQPTANLCKIYARYNKKKYNMLYEVERSLPEKLCFTIYDIHLSQSDTHEMDKNEFFVPQPIISNNGISFNIDPETYEFKKIAQLGKKFLLFLWNKINDKLEIYLDTITHLQRSLDSQSALKKLTLGRRSDEEQNNIHLQYRNIQIKQWYNLDIPKITHFFFIKNTEDVCFVEENGRARIYSLINDNFRAGAAQLPTNCSRIMSTPDGTCFVAFVKEKLVVETSESNVKVIETIPENVCTEIPTITSSQDSQENMDVSRESEVQDNSTLSAINSTQVLNRDIVRGYVYFLEKFNKDANKLIEVPFTNPTIELFQFTSFLNKQLHLISIDLHNNTFQSLMGKVTHAKTKYQFERQTTEKSLGKVKIESYDTFTVFGQNTKFTNDLHIGDFLVIGNEKRQIIKVINDNELKITDRQLFKSLNFGNWYQFKIDPRTKINGLLDVYSMVFTKYSVTNPFGQMDEPLKLTIIMDLNNNNLEIDNYKTKFQIYIRKLFKKFRKETKKPMGHLKKFIANCSTFENFDSLANEYTEYNLGDWIIQLFCLIPIQIAVAHDNEFIPIRDGFFEEAEQSASDDGFGLIGNLSKSISFGWYESIFEYYANLKVKVISSMGEQSCVKINEILYVALDFEGLVSIERSAQEETFLQLLNAALSNLVLFKSHFVVSRDISSMFQRFQDGTNYFGDDPDIFQARFCIVIKDVAMVDRIGIVEEFQLKFAKIVDKEEEDNFITKLYRNKMSIVAWPIFTDSAFYTSIKEFKIKLDEQESQYKNAPTDWGSVQATLITIRTLELKKYLNNAISFGYEQKDDDPFYEENKAINHLTNRDDGTLIPDNDVLISEIFDHIKNSTKIAHDTEITLFEENGNFIKISSDLRKFFEDNVYPRGSIPDSEWVNYLDRFFKFIVDRRIKRVNEWFEKNLARFSKEHNEIVITNYALEREINRLNLFWSICRLSCDQCGLSCLKASRHDDNPDDASHNCQTDHMCHHKCEFTEAHPDGNIPFCEHFAAHQGRHRCSLSHACGAPCIHAGKKNCQKGLCAKDIGHENTKGNEIHKCDSLMHYCGEQCSLNAITPKGKYECQNECIMPCEVEHDIHKCQKDVCPIECPMKNCQRRCDNKNHFHALEKNVTHFCGEEHDCQEKCEEDGICRIVTEPTAIIQEEAEYVNKFGSSMFTKYLQTYQRLPCCVKIPPYMFEHTGQKHVHEIKKPHICNSECPNDDKHIVEQENKQNFHFCDVKCPYCAYYCTMPYGHEKMNNSEHSTAHGNMYLTTFTCEDDDFEFEGHRLNVGDRGDFVLCNKLCENVGRHRHIDYCKDPDTCELGGAKKEGLLEHITAKIGPYPTRKKDYISHRVFWERSGFKDPYSANDREEFKKCDHECIDEKHHIKVDGKNPDKSYCTQKIFHSSLDHNSQIIPDGTGYISADGHHFSCENPTINIGNFHIVFVIDKSGSMNDKDCRPLCNNIKLLGLRHNHNNRLGAVMEAVFTFIETRNKSRKATQVGQMAIDRDTVSLILFDDYAKVAFENRNLANSKEILQEMMKYSAGGGTNFAKGIKSASNLIKTYHDPLKINLIIFLSDGYGSVPENELRDLCQLEKDLGQFTGNSNDYPRMYSFLHSQNTPTVNSLEKMVMIANEYLTKCSDKDSLKCEYVLAVDEIKLIDHFTHVAESLRKHKPTLLKR